MLHSAHRVLSGLLLAGLATTPVGCGDSGLNGPAPDEGLLITWGATTILFHSTLADFENDNLRLIRNFLVRLGEGRQVGGELRLLYTSICDPRTDPDFCQLTPDFEKLQPFFEMVAVIGTIEFDRPSAVNLDDYSAVIADFCDEAGDLDEDLQALVDHVADGGRILALGDNFCFTRLPPGGTPTPSADAANRLTEPLGVTFTELDPQPRDPFLVEPGGFLLDGVSTLTIFRVTPQSIGPGAQAILSSQTGVLAAFVSVPRQP